MFYHAEFSRSTLTGVCISRGNSKNWGALGPRSFGIGARMTGRNTNVPHVLPCAEFGRSVSNRTSVIRRSATITFRLSRSLKVIGTDTNRLATSDFLLTYHSNGGPILYRFQARYWPKVANFPPTKSYLTPPPPQTGLPLELDNGACAHKLDCCC